MELLKPIIVKRWIDDEGNYKKYIFDTNTGNIGDKYNPNDIVINEYIFQDNNIKEALDKIAYHIYKYENNNKKPLVFPYYCWNEKSGNRYFLI